MTKPTDDLQAVRVVAEALQGFDAKDQERIIRWARERLGLSVAPTSLPGTAAQQQSTGESSTTPAAPATASISSGQNLKTFVAAKKPKNDVQFAATVAYFHRFEAPQAQRKSEISSPDLQDACRLAGRKRLTHPGQTLRNALNLGLLDRTSRGTFTINAVGENLVAMTLPHDASAGTAPKGRAKRVRPKAAKRITPKKANK